MDTKYSVQLSSPVVIHGYFFLEMEKGERLGIFIASKR